MRESNHAEFQELCALANTGILSAAERLKVRHHLAVCPACAEAYGEYKALITSGIPALAAAHAHPTEIGGWDERSTRRALLARIKNADQGVRKERNVRSSNGSRNWAVLIRNSWLRAAVAACVLASLGYSTYLLGRRRQPIVQHVSLASTSDPQSAEQEKSIKKRLVSQAEKIALLESESSTRQAELDRLPIGRELDLLERKVFCLVLHIIGR